MYLTALIFGHAFNMLYKGTIEEDVFQTHSFAADASKPHQRWSLKDKPISRNRALETEVAKN